MKVLGALKALFRKRPRVENQESSEPAGTSAGRVEDRDQPVPDAAARTVVGAIDRAIGTYGHYEEKRGRDSHRSFVLTAIATFVGILVLSATAYQARLTRDAVNAAQEANAIAKRSIEARLAVKDIKSGPGPSVRVGSVAEMEIIMRNSGKLPTERVLAASQAYIVPPGSTTPTPTDFRMLPGEFGGDSTTSSIQIKGKSAFSQADVDGINNGSLVLLFVLVIRYADFFGEEKPFRLCLIYVPKDPGNMIHC